MEASMARIKESISRAGVELLRACKDGLDELAVELVSLGMSVDYQCGIGSGTPLIGAVKNGHARLAEKLLRLGANPNLVDIDEKTALMHAAEHCPESIGALLLAGADMEKKDKHGQTALMHAARAESGDAFEQLIARGCDLNARTANGMTALCVSCGPIGRKDRALSLIQAGADVELGSDQGLSPILLSARGADPHVVAALLEAGANANAKTRRLVGADEHGQNAYAHGVTALMIAASSGSNSVVEVLLAAGLDAAEQASTGQAASDFARVNGHLDTEAMLIAHQERIALSNNKGIGHGVDASRKNRI